MSGASEQTVHPRFEPRRSPRSSWWAKAWHLAVEETTYSESDLRKGRQLARAGAVGQITLGVGDSVDGPGGRYLAAVGVGDDQHTVTGAVAGLGPDQSRALVEVVAAGAGRIGSLLAGDLPHDLVSDGEEIGVELLPWSGDLTFTCSCEPWADPCPHAVAVATQVGWLMDADPFVLLTLRGTTREGLLAALNDRLAGGVGDEQDPDADDAAYDDLTVAEEAALRVERVLAALQVFT